MNDIKLIPEPQIIENKPGTFTFSDEIWKHYDDVINTLQNDSINSLRYADITLLLKDDLSFPATMRDDVKEQAYQLNINEEQIIVSAHSKAGLFWGLQTLKQMLEQANCKLQCMSIIDWPNMPFRGVHLTLCTNTPTFEQLKELVVNMSRCKINAFVLEYDDRFPFDKHPIIAHEDALTKSQIKELIGYAKKYFIDIIPLLDSLGHAQEYLKHDEYQYLAELPGDTAEMCPSNHKTLEFIKELWSEILDVHEECKYVHITGDEVFRLGDFCPECRKYAEKDQLSDLFFSYYKDLAEWMLERGKRPIMWADIALKYPESVSVMPKEVIFNDWEYRGSGSKWEVTRIFKAPGMTLDQSNLDAIPGKNRDYFNKYYLNEDGSFKPYPGIAILKDYGFEVIGSSASSTESGEMPVPPFSIAINNNRYNPKAVAENNALGLLNTFWSMYRSINDSMHGVWAGGAYSWKFVEESNENFLNKCESVFMHSDTGEFAKYAMTLDRLDMPKSGAYQPVTESNIAIPMPTARQNEEPVVQRYLEGLGKNAKQMIQNLKQCAGEEKRKETEIGSGQDSTIDLTQNMNTNHAELIHLPGRNFLPMGWGQKECRGVPFNIINPKDNLGNSALGLKGKYRSDWLESVTIKINETYESLFFLNSCAYAPKGDTVAVCEIHYSDGSSCIYPFIIGDNIGDWHKGELNIPNGSPAFLWYGYGDAGPRQGSYMSWWHNPNPDKMITHLQLKPTSQKGYIFFFAITGRKTK